MKVFWFDTETTGTDPVANDIIQIAAIVEIDGEIKEKINLFCQPFDYDTIQPKALEVNGRTIEEFHSFPTPQETFKVFSKLLSKYINQYDKMDKFIPAGYNAKFDIDFLNNWFIKNGSKYFGSYFSWQPIDPLFLIPILRYVGLYSEDNAKLTTVAEYFGITFDAHDAFADIECTKLVCEKILQKIRE